MEKCFSPSQNCYRKWQLCWKKLHLIASLRCTSKRQSRSRITRLELKEDDIPLLLLSWSVIFLSDSCVLISPNRNLDTLDPGMFDLPGFSVKPCCSFKENGLLPLAPLWICVSGSFRTSSASTNSWSLSTEVSETADLIELFEFYPCLEERYMINVRCNRDVISRSASAM